MADWFWQNVVSDFFTEGLALALWLAWKYGADWYYIASHQLTKPFKSPLITKAILVVELVKLD